jgi:hypothetical protein
MRFIYPTPSTVTAPEVTAPAVGAPKVVVVTMGVLAVWESEDELL